MMSLQKAALVGLIVSTVAGCYAYAGPPRHTHERVVVVKEKAPKRVVVRERVVEPDKHHKKHHDHD